VIADPARTGLGPSAAAAVASLRAPVVVLVSCDPASLARDAALLDGHGYTLDRVEVVDAFPSTFHVETVSRFRAAR
jgi:23S rRNA (uracil1939-C5)-methyltransferase